jgi:hypothetical protein
MTGGMTLPWTPSDDERLRKLAAEGPSSVTIAERMKRSPAPIRDHAKKLKISLRRPGDSGGVARARINHLPAGSPSSYQRRSAPKARETIGRTCLPSASLFDGLWLGGPTMRPREPLPIFVWLTMIGLMFVGGGTYLIGYWALIK